MESLSIDLLEKFGTSLAIVPYFGPAHQSFLLLSKLNRKSRKMLDDNFEGILNWLIRYSACLTLNRENEGIFNLPSNLFKYNIHLDTSNKIKSFLRFVGKISRKEGHFFNEHSLNSRLWIVELWIETIFVEELYPDLELLRNTEAIELIGINTKLYITFKQLISRIH